jgi:hypothetical protein
MEIESFNGYIPNYPIMMSSPVDHHDSSYTTSYHYQFPNENLIVGSWNNQPEAFVNQHDLSTSSPTFYYQSSTLNSTNSDESRPTSSVTSTTSRNKRGRKKKKVDEEKITKSESPPNPTILKKRRLAANARERRRMSGLNSAFDRSEFKLKINFYYLKI